MNVKQLIRALKKMPQNLEVGFSHHDNSDGEIAAWVESVSMVDEVDIGTGKLTGRKVIALRP